MMRCKKAIVLIQVDADESDIEALCTEGVSAWLFETPVRGLWKDDSKSWVCCPITVFLLIFYLILLFGIDCMSRLQCQAYSARNLTWVDKLDGLTLKKADPAPTRETSDPCPAVAHPIR